MFSLYKKELQSYFLSPIAYFVIAFFMATFSLTFIQEIGNVSSSTYTFSFSSIFYVNIFYFIFLLPLLTMRTFSEERKRHGNLAALQPAERHADRYGKVSPRRPVC
ncbi:MAG: ABC transporter permease [Ruminococcus callidus]